MQKKILVVDKMHDSLEESFQRIGYQIEYSPDVQKDRAIKLLSSGDYQGAIVRSKIKFTAEILDRIKIKFIARAGAGVDNIDLESAKRNNIEIFNAPEGNKDAVAEHCMGMILSLLNNLRKADREVRKGVWDREGNRGFELRGKTVGILGFGHMGKCLAEKLRGFSCKVIAYDRSKTGFGNEFVQEVDFDTFKKETEILSIHIQLDQQNHKLIDKYYLEAFHKLYLLINTARGEVLVLKDILEYLKMGKLTGVALDVLENEKLNNLSDEEKAVLSELSGMFNVLFTPHIAGWTFESYKRINEVLASKVAALQL